MVHDLRIQEHDIWNPYLICFKPQLLDAFKLSWLPGQILVLPGLQHTMNWSFTPSTLLRSIIFTHITLVHRVTARCLTSVILSK